MNPQQQLPAKPLDPKAQAIQQIKSAANVLVTVSTNPTVDQLAAAIGTTLVLNKLGKHATAVFSGEIPSTIEFLQPEKTFEKTTDSLRDFIIALDKSKADKLRYKVEDKYVKIFITPYHTSLTDKDLEFSQGDYNVDVVLALGVKKKEELDQALANHGRILHDAAVISLNTQPGADLGSVNLDVPDASSLCEVMVLISDTIKDEQKPLYDAQIATAFLTGVVAETNRFSNEKTTPQTMSTAAKLMNAGANQQLIATKLEEPKPIPQEPEQSPEPPEAQPPAGPPKPPDTQPPAGPASPPKNSLPPPPAPAAPAVKAVEPEKPKADGSLQIQHESKPEFKLPSPDAEVDEEGQDSIDRIHIDEEGQLRRLAELEADKDKTGDEPAESRKVVENPPKLGGSLSSTAGPGVTPATTDALSQTAKPQILNRNVGKLPSPPAQDKEETLTELEKEVGAHKTPIGDVKPGGALGVDYPEQVVGKDTGLPPDKTAGAAEPSAPPPVPPPIPGLGGSPPTHDNMNGPGSGVPL